MSKAFLTEDTPSLFENVCQVSKTAKANKRPSKSDYLSLRKSLRELDFRDLKPYKIIPEYHIFKQDNFSLFYYADYSKDAKKEFSRMYDFLEKNYKDFSILFNHITHRKGYYGNTESVNKEGRICEFLKHIKQAYFKNIFIDYAFIDYRVINRIDLEKDKKYKFLNLKIEKYLKEKTIKEHIDLLRFMKREQTRYEKIFNQYQHINTLLNEIKFYDKHELKIQSFLQEKFKGKFNKNIRNYDNRYKYLTARLFFKNCLEGFVKVLNEDKEKMREFVNLLERLKDASKPIITRYTNEVAGNNYVYYIEHQPHENEKERNYKALKFSDISKEFREAFLKNTNKEEK